MSYRINATQPSAPTRTASTVTMGGITQPTPESIAAQNAASDAKWGGSSGDYPQQRAEARAMEAARDRALYDGLGAEGRSQRYQNYFAQELAQASADAPATEQYARTGHTNVDRALAESNAKLRRLASDLRSERAISAAIDLAKNPDLSRPVQHARPGRTAEHAPAVPRSPSRDQLENARRVAVDRCTREDAPGKFGEYFSAALGG